MRLPTLLASLPRDGKHALVRPQVWPENSFYRVTKTNLKFREVPGSEPNETYLRAKGKAWGQLFWKGKQVHPRDRHSPAIKHALKHKWEIVPPASVSSLSTAFAQADQAQNQAEAAAKADLVKKREAKRVRVAEAAAAKRQLEAEKEERMAKHQAWIDELHQAARERRQAKEREAEGVAPPSSE